MSRIIVMIGIVALLFFPVFLGKVPFPGNYLLAWYEPWRTSTENASSLGIAHKAVADDVLRQIYPFKELASEMMRNGNWPLWNPYNGAGQPLLATMHPGFFNPFSLLMVLIPGIWGWTFYILCQPLLLGFLTYLYLRGAKVSRSGSVFGVAALITSGFAVTRYIYGDYIFALCTLPLLLLLIDRWVINRKAIILLGIPPTVAFLLFSVQPQIAVYILVFTMFYALEKAIKDQNTLFSSLISILSAIIAGFVLAAIQLLPTFDLFRQANMTTAASAFIMQKYLLPLSHLVTIIIPNYFGNPGTYNWWGHVDYVETIVSMGTIPVFFAIYAWVKRKMHPTVGFYWLMILVTLFLSLDSSVTRYLYGLPLPILSTAIPSRIFILTTFSFAVLAAFGFDRLKNDRWKIPRGFAFAFIGVLALVFIVSLIFASAHVGCEAQIKTCRTVALRNTLLEMAAFFVFIVAVYFSHTRRIKKYISYIIISIVVFIGWYNSTKFFPFSPQSSVYPSNVLVTELKNLSSNMRMVGFGTAVIETDLATQLRLYDPQYYDPLYLKRYGELVAYSKSDDRGTPDLSRSDVEIETNIQIPLPQEKGRSRLLDLASIGYIFYKREEFFKYYTSSEPIVWQDNNWVVVKNLHALPRAYLVNSYEVINSSQNILRRLYDMSFDPSKAVILEQKLPINSVTTVTYQQANIISYKPNKVLIDTTTGNASILVLTDNYDPGWNAYIDNVKIQVYRANYSFRAVIVPAGKHEIRFEYQPKSFILGALISGSTCMLLICILIYLRKK